MCVLYGQVARVRPVLPGRTDLPQTQRSAPAAQLAGSPPRKAAPSALPVKTVRCFMEPVVDNPVGSVLVLSQSLLPSVPVPTVPLVGDAFAGTFASSANSFSCTRCPSDTFATADGTRCEACSSEGMVCVGGMQRFSADYWRGYRDLEPKNVTVATVFHQVQAPRAPACLFRLLPL